MREPFDSVLTESIMLATTNTLCFSTKILYESADIYENSAKTDRLSTRKM